MKISLVLIIAITTAATAAFFILSPASFSLVPSDAKLSGQVVQGQPATVPPSSKSPSSDSTAPTTTPTNPSGDEPPQPQLVNPPAIVKGVYMTSWVAGTVKQRAHVESVVTRNNFNAIVVDIKDYSGYVTYDTDVPAVAASGAEGQLRMKRPNAMIKEMHDKGIYIIGRVSTFQDPVLAKAHPEWALKSKKTGNLWRDRKGLAWMDVGAQPVWDYNIALAKDALARGVDEIQFDYIRFPSDGTLSDIIYPYWNGTTPKHDEVGKFFRYVKQQLPNDRVSADLFGLSTNQTDDLGIGQLIEDGYKNFDYVSPMTYPSHYASGALGYKNPALYPYEILHYAMTGGLKRWQALSNATSSSPTPPPHIAKLRPWLQVFDLGAVYNRAMVQKQIQAVEDVLGKHPEAYAGFLLWDPKNEYRPYSQ